MTQTTIDPRFSGPINWTNSLIEGMTGIALNSTAEMRAANSARRDCSVARKAYPVWLRAELCWEDVHVDENINGLFEITWAAANIGTAGSMVEAKILAEKAINRARISARS